MTKELPTGWEKLKVQDVSKIYLGLTHTPQYIDNGIPFLSVKNISAGKIDFKDTKFISKEEFNSLPDGAKPQKGDVLFARVGTLGCPSIVDTEQPFGTFVSLGFFRVNKNKILNTYIRYWMMSPSFWEQVNINVQGSTLKNLNTGWLKNFEINVPSLTEQKRIVEKLDKIFADIDKAKENTEKNLENAKEVFNSRLQHLFSTGIQNAIFVKLIDLVDITSSKRIFKHEYVPQGVPFYRTKEIKELAHNKPITLELFISENKYKEIKMKFGVPSKNDLLISAVGTIGEMYIVPNEQPFYFKDGNILWIKNYKKDLLPEFLKYALQSYITKIQALAQGTAYNALTIEKLTQYKIPYVDIFAQRTLVSSLDSIFAQTQELEQIYTKKLTDLDELKQTVLQRAFSGKL